MFKQIILLFAVLIPSLCFGTSVKFIIIENERDEKVVVDIVTSIKVNNVPLSNNIHFKTNKVLIYWESNQESLKK